MTGERKNALYRLVLDQDLAKCLARGKLTVHDVRVGDEGVDDGGQTMGHGQGVAGVAPNGGADARRHDQDGRIACGVAE